MNYLFVFSAPSGSGKTTIVKEILKLFPEFEFSISATTRKQRENEINGKDYFFITKADFIEKIENKEFIEYELIYDNNYYGTLKKTIDDFLEKGKNILFDMDVKGALSLKRIYGEKSVLIFVNPPDKNAIIERLKNRGTETEDMLEKRIGRIDFEMNKMNEFDYIVNNDNLENAVSNAKKIIKKYIEEKSNVNQNN